MKKMIQPLVSIVIPCYNHEHFVKDCVQSIINQTYRNIELIIIDDGSVDNSILRIEEMINICNSRFNSFKFIKRENRGLCATLNEALSICNGKYFSAIASDDVLLDQKIQKQVEYLEKNLDCVAVFGGVNLIDKNSKFIKKIIPRDKDLSFHNIIMSNYAIFAPTQLIRMKSLLSLGSQPYPTHLKIEDWYMWLKLAQIGKLKNIQEVFVGYRQHDSNTSKKIAIIQKGRVDVISEFSNIDTKIPLRIVNLINAFENKDFKKIIKIIFIFNKSVNLMFIKIIISSIIGKIKL